MLAKIHQTVLKFTIIEVIKDENETDLDLITFGIYLGKKDYDERIVVTNVLEDTYDKLIAEINAEPKVAAKLVGEYLVSNKIDKEGNCPR